MQEIGQKVSQDNNLLEINKTGQQTQKRQNQQRFGEINLNMRKFKIKTTNIQIKITKYKLD